MLRGKKTRLRAVEREDIPLFLRWFNDPEIRQYLSMYMPVSADEEERWFERQMDRQDARILAIETVEGVHIGNIGLHDLDWKNRNAQLGVVIGEKAYWGLGYGTDAIKALLRFAFDEMNLHRVQLRVFDFNERAIRCYRRCGFREEGRLRQELYRDGAYHDVLLMGILREEFHALSEAAAQTAAEAPSQTPPKEG